MTVREGGRISVGVVVTFLLVGWVSVVEAQSSVTIYGETGTNICLESTAYIPPKVDCRQVAGNLVFYSVWGFDGAVLTVLSCSSDVRVAIDGEAPRRVVAGDELAATEEIKVTQGWMKWKLYVYATGSVALRYIGELSDEVHVTPQFPKGNPARSKTLFSGKWSPDSNWVVIHIRSYGDVWWNEGHQTLFPGDHVFSISKLEWPLWMKFWYTFPIPEFTVRVSGDYNGGVKATMWKWW